VGSSNIGELDLVRSVIRRLEEGSKVNKHF